MRIVIILLFLGIQGIAHAEEFYVSTRGSDKNLGTKGKPFRTLGHAAKQAKAGDTIVIRAGTYRETLRVDISGTSTRPITFMSAPGEKVVVSGADLLENWEPYEGSILKSTIPDALEPGFNQVFVNEKMMHQARYPNEGSEDLLRPTLIDMKAAEDRIASDDLTQPDGFWNGGFVVGGFGHRWSFQWARITESKAGVLTLGERSQPWFTGRGHAYVTGVLGALDAPGEWHIESNSLYFWPPDDVDLKDAKVEVKQRPICVDFNGQSYVRVQGIAIHAGTVRMAGNSCTLENCEIDYPSHFTYFPWNGYHPDGGADKGHNGILVEGDDNIVRGCTITNSAGSGIVIKGARNLITRCNISNISYAGTYSCPLALPKNRTKKLVGSNRIWFNTIRRSGRDCMQLTGADADDVRYNDFSEAGLLCKDLGMLYVYGRDGNGTRIAYNWVHDNRGKGPNPGIYLDNYCSNFVVDHNVIWNCEAGVRVNAPAKGHLVYNNTLFQCHDVGTNTYNQYPRHMPQYWKAAGYGDIYEYTRANNLFLGNEANVQVEDVKNRKFGLKRGALAIDAGKPIPGTIDKYVGKAPDLGAYELGGPYWTPGVHGTAE